MTNPTREALRRFVRRHGPEFLADPNVSSIGIGFKVIDGRVTDTVSIQFTVHAKLPADRLETVDTTPLPQTITVGATPVPTDVLQRSFVPAYEVVPEAAADERKGRVDPVVPGVSIAHPTVSAGTLGCIVYAADDATPLLLSNWHVLQGPYGKVGDQVLQPGPHDDNRQARNHVGTLVRSHLGIAGDCAVATIEGRGLDPEILGLGVAPNELGDAELGDKVVKSSRTTGVTHGVVTRVDTIVKLDYGEGVGPRQVGGLEIGPDPGRRDGDTRLSDGGDSGAAWLFKAGNGRPTRTLAGLHFAGDAGVGDEHALACLPRSVFDKLGITLATDHLEAVRPVVGFDPAFLAARVEVPTVTPDLTDDLVVVEGSTTIPYTHFSLAQSQSRRFARWVAWNVDGSALKKLDRSSMKFSLDPRVPPSAQVGDELYAGNDLDRGHLARRADLTWGPDAAKANADSFFFTNITPQLNTFNQAMRQGVWGRLEDAVYDEVEVDRLRISVFGGPILRSDDRPYRGVPLPREFWKVIAFVEKGALTARAFVLAQDLDRLEAFELPSFATFQVSLAEVTRRTGVVLDAALRARPEPQAVEEPRRIDRLPDITW